ncbi:MAG: AI-2E family transporter [Candidatus Moranbacteria bacterium]|nr:AI-2E family transporter [Candidatus Moranbacteria bacterium]
MKKHDFNMYLFLLLLLVAGAAVFFIFQPFLTAIVVAAVFAVLLRGMNRRFRKVLFGNRPAAAAILCLIVALLIVAPISIVVAFAVNEANVFYHSGQSAEVVGKAAEFVDQSPLLRSVFPGGDLADRLSNSLRSVSTSTVTALGAAYQGVVQFILWLFVFFFTLFYFMLDGESILRQLKRFSPLDDAQDVLLFKKFTSISRAMIKGTLVVGAVQGLLAGFAFAIAGVPSPAVLGIIVALASLIPGVGTALVWIPTGLILFVGGDVWQGVFVLSFGLGVISVIDNILRPRLVGRDTEMHPLLVFFATLGGITFFGFPGLLIGPVVVSLFFALADIYALGYGAKVDNGNASLTSSS